MKNSGAILASLVGGLIVGAAITALFTPKTGPEMRRLIKDRIDEEMNKVRCHCDEKGNCECEEK